MEFGSLKMYIDGKLVSSANNKTKDIISPLNDEKIANLSWGSDKDSVRALKSAKKGFELWSNTPVEVRKKWTEKFENIFFLTLNNVFWVRSL